MKNFLSNHWLIGIIIFFITHLTLSYIFDLEPRCHSGWRSPSIGKSGACSHHGGVDRSAQSAAFLFSLVMGCVSGVYFGTRQSHRLRQKIKLKVLDKNNLNLPNCPFHGNMIIFIDEQGEKYIACRKYPECKYFISHPK